MVVKVKVLFNYRNNFSIFLQNKAVYFLVSPRGGVLSLLICPGWGNERQVKNSGEGHSNSSN